MELEITGASIKSEVRRKVDVPAAQVPRGAVFDAFGFYTPKMTNGTAASTLDVYADDLLYAGSVSTR